MTVLSALGYVSQEKAKEKKAENKLKAKAEKKAEKIAKKQKAAEKQKVTKTKTRFTKTTPLEFDFEYETKTFTRPVTIAAMDAMKMALGHLQGKVDFIKSSIDKSHQVTRFVLPRIVASPSRFKESRQAKYLDKISLAQATTYSAQAALESASLAINMADNIVCQAWDQGVLGYTFPHNIQLERMQMDMKKLTIERIRKIGGNLEMAIATSKLPLSDLYKIEEAHRTQYSQGIECTHGRYAFKMKPALQDVQTWAIDADAKRYDLDKDLWTSRGTWWKNSYGDDNNTDHNSAQMVYRVLQLVKSAAQCLTSADHVVHLAEHVRMGAMECMQFEYGQLDGCPLPDAFNEYHVEKDHLDAIRSAGEKVQKAWLQAAAVSNAADREYRPSTFCTILSYTL